MSYSFIQDEARNDEVDVSDSNTIIAFARTEANPRKALIIRNTSTGGQVITVNLGLSNAIAGKGIVLQPKESFTDSSEAGYKCFQGTINAIGDIAGGKIAIMER